MATWFTGVFESLDDVLFDIRIEDQNHSARLLREGVVMGAGYGGAPAGDRDVGCSHWA